MRPLTKRISDNKDFGSPKQRLGSVEHWTENQSEVKETDHDEEFGPTFDIELREGRGRKNDHTCEDGRPYYTPGSIPDVFHPYYQTSLIKRK